MGKTLLAKVWGPESGSNIHVTNQAWWHTPIVPEQGGEDRRTPAARWLPA